MSEKPRLVNITMVRENLDDLPEYELPKPYSFRLYQAGDEKTFDDVWIAADKEGQAREGLFEREFRANIDAVGERMCFLLDGEGRPVGTGTAWFNDDFEGTRWGVVHWVAMVPPHQGRALAKPLMSVILKRLGELGHDRVYLVTQTVRLPAINLYFGFGFEPFVKTPQDRENWRKVRENLAKLSR